MSKNFTNALLAVCLMPCTTLMAAGTATPVTSPMPTSTTTTTSTTPTTSTTTTKSTPLPTTSNATTTTTTTATKAPTEREFRHCVQQMNSSLGRYEIVSQALSLYQITQSQWSPIIHDFQRRLHNLYSLFETAAKKSVPNALRPFNAQEAQRILQEVLLQMWTESLSVSKSVNSANNSSAAVPTLEFIIRKQPENVRHCLMDQFEAPTTPTPPSGRNFKPGTRTTP